MRCVFVRFLGESSALTICFRNQLTFNTVLEFVPLCNDRQALLEMARSAHAPHTPHMNFQSAILYIRGHILKIAP